MPGTPRVGGWGCKFEAVAVSTAHPAAAGLIDGGVKDLTVVEVF